MLTWLRSLAMLAAVVGASLTSCATIVTGSHDDVRITSEPPGAEYETNTGQKGITPAVVTVADSDTLKVSLKKAGYLPQSAELEPKMSPWIFGNILLGGIIGVAIDLISGEYRTHAGELVVHLTVDPNYKAPPVSP